MGVVCLMGVYNFDVEKLSEYECGFFVFEDLCSQFDVWFYLVVILFIIFDLEVVFLFFWVVLFDFIGWVGWIIMMVFFGELVIGFVYVWKKGVLDWE